MPATCGGWTHFEASDAIRARLGHEYWTSCIGPGGENLVSFACVTENKNGMLGRAGLGAVAGSKKLKGIAVRGTKGDKGSTRGGSSASWPRKCAAG